MPGPPPIPNERKRLLGNPGKRSLPPEGSTVALVPLQGSVVVPPEHLGSAGRECWARITRFASGWIGASDEGVVTQLCEALDLREELREAIAIVGVMAADEKGKLYANPAVKMLRDLDDQITKWWSVLGLTPADRTRLGVAEVKKQSKLEELMKRRSDAAEEAERAAG